MSNADGDLIRRAFAAWFRNGGTDRPTNDSGVITHGGKTYVVLQNLSDVLAVYRVRNDGVLKRLRRWPSDVVVKHV